MPRGEPMSLLIELLIDCSGWMLEPLLGLFGYGKDWEPIRPSTKSQRTVVQAIVSFAISAIFLGGLIWLGWFLTR
jgi:hypothetical protein